MNSTTSPHSARRSSPVRDSSTPHMRAVRKELLLLRAEVERAEFVQARAELRQKFSNLGWLKLLVPGLGSVRPKGSGRGVNATIMDWVLNHPLASSVASLALGKPLRATIAAGAKPLLKWGALGSAAWAGLRLWSHLARKRNEPTPSEQDEASKE
ncbi:DUF3318 domain-containing protein [Trinickia sp.]|uniref:DUF3318 domain-containing protein n=1 Tax=Trinickia sp. TaxID=2571163 RepID=UPI003F817590